VATGLVCITTGWLHIHDPKARFRTDFRILNGDVPSCAPGRILGHERVDVTRRLRSGRVPAAVSGTSKRPAPITEKGLIPNLFQMFHMFLWVLAPGQAPLAAASFKLVVSFDSL
jgi:hypothetical protein